MSSEYWQGVLNRLPNFLLQTSAMCFTADALTRSCRHPHFMYSIFPPMGTYMPYRSFMPYQTYMPYQQYTPYQTYTPYQQYSPYRSPYPTAPGMSPMLQTFTDAGKVEDSQSTNLGEHLVTAPETEFVSEQWKELDQKKNLTPIDNIKLHSKYNDFIGNLGKSFTSFIDKSNAGDKDGYISKEEFKTYYASQLAKQNSTQEEIDKLKAEADKIFTSLDLSKEGKLDWKELSSFLALADASGTNGKYDGTIKNEDMLKALKTVKDGGITTQNKLKENYNNIFNRLS